MTNDKCFQTQCKYHIEELIGKVLYIYIEGDNNKDVNRAGWLYWLCEILHYSKYNNVSKILFVVDMSFLHEIKPPYSCIQGGQKR